MKEEEIIQAGIDYTLSTNPRCIAGDAFDDIADMMNRNSSFEAGAKWMQEKMIDKACEWLKYNIYDYFYWIEMEGESEANIKDTLFDDFKKAMKQ